MLVHPDDRVFIGLPDTVWFPVDALRALPDEELALLLFPVQRPALFDAVVTRSDGSVVEIQVKVASPTSSWVWGAMGMPGHVFLALRDLWLSRGSSDEYLGHLLNAWITRGHRVAGVRAGDVYVDVGTVHGYREALAVLDGVAAPAVRATAAGPRG
jgi:tRNA (mo5U34)-methyltransferase